MSWKKQLLSLGSLKNLSEKAQEILGATKDDPNIKDKQVEIELPVDDTPELKISFSLKNIILTTLSILGIVALVWVVYTLRDKLILLLLAAFLATVMDPGVQFLERRKFPRALAIIIFYLVAIVILGFLLVSFIPIIAEQISQIAEQLSELSNSLANGEALEIPFFSNDMNVQFNTWLQAALEGLSTDQFTGSLERLSQSLSSAASTSFQIAGSVVSFIVSFIMVLALAFFIQLEREKVLSWIESLLPKSMLGYAKTKSGAIHHKIGQWARGELMLMVSIFLLTYIALKILGMPYALTLAVLAGFCEMIPVVGPLIASLPALLIGFTDKGFVWLLVIAVVYYIIQWCENNLLVPMIMKRAVGLSPIAILMAMLIGISFPDTIHPVLGVILAIPAMTIFTLFIEDFRGANKK